MSKHSPTPWEVAKGLYGDPNGRTIWASKTRSRGQCRVATIDSAYNPKGDAEFLVLAANCHDELLAALQSMRRVFDPFDPTPEQAAACDAADEAVFKALGVKKREAVK